MNDRELFAYTIHLLQRLAVKHEAHHFPSGAIMLDVWYDNLFYVFQFEPGCIGFSEVNKINVGFDTVPDERLYTKDAFINKLTLLFARQ